MKKRRLVCWTVGLAALLVVLPLLLWGGYAAYSLFRGEHFYQGLPTSYWRRVARRYLEDPCGSDPVLDRLPLQLRRLADYFGLRSDCQISCVPEAIPVFADLLRDPDPMIRGFALSTLNDIGPPAIPVIASALAHPDPADRTGAAVSLQQMGPVAAMAAPALFDALLDDDRQVREAAASALGSIGPSPVARLLQALKDPNRRIREGAAIAFGVMQPVPLGAIPSLVDALGDEDEEVRKWAKWALRKLGKAAFPSLIAALADNRQTLRNEAILTLSWCDATEVLELARALRHPDVRVRRGIAAAIGRERLGDERSASPALVEALRDKDAEVRQAAAKALMRMDIETAKRLGLK